MSFKTSDPNDELFEEFEFKPLSAGLGFHKKTDKGPAATLPAAAKSAKTETVDLKMPLPRKGGNSAISEKNSPMIDSLKEVLTEKAYNRIKTERPWEIDDSPAAPTSAATALAGDGAWKRTSFDLTALLVDCLVITGFFLVSLVVFMATTGVDVVRLLSSGVLDENIVSGLIVLLVSVAWIYMVSCRLFAGVTAGEYIFDQRLGLPVDQAKGNFGWKVAARTTLLFATGLVVFPLIEEITSKDLLGNLLRIHHYRKATAPNAARSPGSTAAAVPAK